MKRQIIVISLIFIAFASFAKNWQKEYKKIIERCDAPVQARDDAATPDEFWFYTIWYNPTYADFADAVSKKKSTAIKALQNIESAKNLSSTHYDSLDKVTDENAVDLAEVLKRDLRAMSVSDDVKIYFVESDQINACVTPDGTMFIFTGLVDLPEIRYEHLLGICAHEMTHYTLQHATTHMYAAEKKLNKNKIWAGVASGLLAVGGIYAATQGYDMSTSVCLLSEAAFNIAFVDAQNYYYKYSRDQEYEADLHAYRYMEAAGFNGDYYIEALEIIQKYEGDVKVNEKNSDHPLTENRIGLLTYAKEHPEVHHKKPKKTFDNVKL